MCWMLGRRIRMFLFEEHGDEGWVRLVVIEVYICFEYCKK